MEPFIDPSLDPSLNGGGGDMGEGGIPPMVGETVWQKIWRFVLGLFGLDSSSPIINDPRVVPPSEDVPVQPIPGKG